MTNAVVAHEPNRSRVLPAVVISLFALVALADIVVIILYGNYRNVIEEMGVEVAFTPSSPSRHDRGGAGADPADDRVVLSDGGCAMTRDGVTMATMDNDEILVRAPGELTMRFRAPDAGSFIEVEYEFRDPIERARCVVRVARVASRHGVDVVRRRDLVGDRKPSGVFRHYLADHAGWFELSLRVNAAAAEGGLLVGLPEIVRE